MKALILPFLTLATLAFANDKEHGSPSSAEMSDAHIANILLTANEAEIDEAKLAKKKAHDPRVKSMAEMMLRDHTESKKAVEAWLKKSKTKKKDSEESKSLASSAKESKKMLKNLKDEKFDAAYIKEQVDDHERVLSTIDGTLLPNAQNAELKALLEKTRPVISGHLQHAKELQSSSAASE